jgi:hypothetical protein
MTRTQNILFDAGWHRRGDLFNLAIADYRRQLFLLGGLRALYSRRFIAGEWPEYAEEGCATYVILSVFWDLIGRGIRLQDNTR